MTGGHVARGGPDRPVVVVGGGVIGLCLAHHLAASGAQVDVIERHHVGAAASWGNAGWVCESHSAPIPAPGVMRDALASLGRPDSPLYLRPFADPSFAGWMWRFWRSTSPQRFAAAYRAVAELNRDTFALFDDLSAAGVDTTLRRVGMVHAFRSSEQAERMRRSQLEVAAGRFDMGDPIVEGDAAAALDPSLSDGVRAAYLVPGEGVVDPERLTAALSKKARERGVRIHEHTTVTGFRSQSDRVVGVETSDGVLDCSSVAITAGSWSGRLVRALGTRIPIQAGKGYSFVVDLASPPTHALYLGDSKTAVTPLDGATRIAGTMEFSGNNRTLNWRRIVAVAQASTRYLGPWFTDADDLTTQIRDPWVGSRPLLPDGLPIIDRLPSRANAYLATGHGMLGVTLAPVTGRRLAELMMTGRRADVLRPFAVGRPALGAGAV